MHIGYPDFVYDSIFKKEKEDDDSSCDFYGYVASLIGEEKNNIVGYILLQIGKKNTDGYIQGLFVEPQYRHLGIGKRLLAETEAYIKAIGGEKIDLTAQSRLVDFYLRQGFGIERKNDSKYIMSKNLREKLVEKDEEYER